MNDGFLRADCVIESLSRCGFIFVKDWKHNTAESCYDVFFTLCGTRASIVAFQIVVARNNHLIAKSSLRILERRFAKDFSFIFALCDSDH